MNVAHYKMVLEQIKAHAETWEQEIWHSHCGTRHCFAGWAQLLAGRFNATVYNKLPLFGREDYVRKDAMSFLEIDGKEADYLFSGYRTISNFEHFLQAYTAGTLKFADYPPPLPTEPDVPTEPLAEEELLACP